MLAEYEAQPPISKNINQELKNNLLPTRTLEVIKGVRRSDRYKNIVRQTILLLEQQQQRQISLSSPDTETSHQPAAVEAEEATPVDVPPAIDPEHQEDQLIVPQHRTALKRRYTSFHSSSELRPPRKCMK